MPGATNVVPQNTNNRDTGSGFDPSGIQAVASRITNVQNVGGYNYGDTGVALADGQDVTQGATTDTAWSLAGNATLNALLKKIALVLSSTLAIIVKDATTTGTISAAQPVIGTPVTSATVTLALSNGQSSWKAVLTGANFTANSTIVVDHTTDGSITWLPSSFRVTGGTALVQSVTGPSSIELSGNDVSVSSVRIRCSVLGSGDSISVYIRTGGGVANPHLFSSLPSGSNFLGYQGTTTNGVVSGSGAATTTAATDYSYTFAQKVNHFLLQNNTNAILQYDLDVAATGGSIVLGPNATALFDVQVTVLHLYAAAAQNVGGSTNGNIVIRGWL